MSGKIPFLEMFSLLQRRGDLAEAVDSWQITVAEIKAAGYTGIIFTGGIGENVNVVRDAICDGFECFGIKLDKNANDEAIGVERNISAKDSKVTVLAIPTDEEFMIASDTLEIVKK